MKERKIGERHSFERERARISLISRSIFFRFRAQKRLIHGSSATAASREDFCSRKPKERVSMGRNCSIDNCSLGVLIALATVLATGFNWDTRVTTKFGDIKGLWSNSSRGRLVAHYLGIPYALPPLGDLRFRVSLLLLLFACTEKYFRSILQSVKFFFLFIIVYEIEPPAVGSKVERDVGSHEKQPIVLSDVKGWEHGWRGGLSLSQCLRAQSE